MAIHWEWIPQFNYLLSTQVIPFVHPEPIAWSAAVFSFVSLSSLLVFSVGEGPANP